MGVAMLRRKDLSSRLAGVGGFELRSLLLSMTTPISSATLVTSPQHHVRLSPNPELRSQGGTVIAGVPGDLCGRRSRQKRPGWVWPGRFHQGPRRLYGIVRFLAPWRI